jgi:NAD(P)-dependent dehydrogenase (short-subunit alcohol dehydrogenase family)
MSSSMQGKRVLVTGASRGVGAAVAEAFAAAGAEVVATARTEAKLELLRERVAAAGGRLRPLAGDLSTRTGARGVARQAGEIDVLVNNAALVAGKQHSILVEDDEGWDAEFAINLVAPVVRGSSRIPAKAAG